MDFKQLVNKARGLAEQHSDKLGPLGRFLGNDEPEKKSRRNRAKQQRGPKDQRTPPVNAPDPASVETRGGEGS